MLEPNERFWSKVDTSGDCWLWKASLTADGYGQFFVTGKRWRAHRWSYTEAFGPITDGMEIDHLCRVRACVRPEHLEAVTHRENQKRGLGATAVNIDATHCKHGHEFTPENTYFHEKRGSRQCRTCQNERKRLAYWRDREVAQ